MTTKEAMQNIEVALRKEVRVSVEIAEILLASLATIKNAMAEQEEQQKEHHDGRNM